MHSVVVPWGLVDRAFGILGIGREQQATVQRLALRPFLCMTEYRPLILVGLTDTQTPSFFEAVVLHGEKVP